MSCHTKYLNIVTNHGDFCPDVCHTDGVCFGCRQLLIFMPIQCCFYFRWFFLILSLSLSPRSLCARSGVHRQSSRPKHLKRSVPDSPTSDITKLRITLKMVSYSKLFAPVEPKRSDSFCLLAGPRSYVIWVVH